MLNLSGFTNQNFSYTGLADYRSLRTFQALGLFYLEMRCFRYMNAKELLQTVFVLFSVRVQ